MARAVDLEDTGGPNEGSTGLGRGNSKGELEGKKVCASARGPGVGYKSDLK